MTDWRVIRTCALGAELSLCGFGWGRDLFHAYLRLGVVTVYVASQRLDRALATWNAARRQLAIIAGRRIESPSIDPTPAPPADDNWERISDPAWRTLKESIVGAASAGAISTETAERMITRFRLKGR